MAGEDFEGFLIVVEELDYVVAFLDFARVEQRHRQELPQQARAHCGTASVDGLEEADALLARVGLEDFQVAEGELVHPDKLLFVDARQGANVLEAAVAGLFEIDHKGTGGPDCEREAVHGEALEGLDVELGAELVNRGVIDKGPLVQAADVVVGVFFAHCPAQLALDHKLLGIEAAQQGGYVVDCALGDFEGARGDIQEGCTALLAVEAQAGKEVVFLLVEYAFGEGYAGSEDFGHTPFDQLVLDQVGVFELVADGYLVARTHQLLEIDLKGVVREARHRAGFLAAVGALGKHKAEDLADQHGVIRVGFVKVSHTIEQHSFRVLGLDAEILLEHRGIFRTLCHKGLLFFERLQGGSRKAEEHYEYEADAAAARDQLSVAV